ncbi:DUF3887 domain-containing protein [Oceanobacillus jeddahense]|uniref:DUF3887 domain-containing protein n=1 Tax=Oceanobacillus jeddahense TaxID=1462527 RepID=A0ABY5K094_9BACI|nr:DUF3887 domain-containing protein [Oceanobacillus jeddahense]UUI04194.1 DUF3887 domain-containing protein [Oceanobacillus jeddahense]
MKLKQLTILLTVILLVVILSACGETVSEIDEENRETARDEAVQTAEDFLTLLGEEEFEQAASLFNENPIREWTAEDFEDLFVPTAETYGGLAEIQLVEEEEGTSVFDFVFEGNFGVRTVLFYIGINRSNEVFNFRTNINPDLQFSDSTHEVAEAFLDFANEGEFEEAADLFDDNMELEITSEDIAADWRNFEEEYGAFTQFNLYEEQTFSSDYSLIYVGAFGEQLVLFNVYLNEDNEITGYYSRIYNEEEDYIYPEEAHQTADDFLTRIVEEDFEDAADLLSEEAETDTTPEDLERWRNNIEQEYGELVRFELDHEEDYYGPPAGNYAFVYEGEFTEQNAAVIVYVNQENEVSGYRHSDFEREE